VAAKEGRVDVVKWLIERGAQLDAKDEVRIDTVQHRARIMKARIMVPSLCNVNHIKPMKLSYLHYFKHLIAILAITRKRWLLRWPNSQTDFNECFLIFRWTIS
jgi:hypothetical protein